MRISTVLQHQEAGLPWPVHVVPINGLRFLNPNFRKDSVRRMHYVRAVFENGNFEETDFGAGFLQEATFKNCNLKNAGFIRANLKGARFIDCNLEGVTWPKTEPNWDIENTKN